MNTSKKYILIDVVPPTVKREDAMQDLDEMVSLIKTYGGGKIVEIIQRRANPHPGTYIGSGKAEEVAGLIEKYHIDTIIINGIASSTQQYKLLKMYWKVNPNIEVWDRVDLILHIFDKHARTIEAKLQIKLAQMQHMGPRMYGLSEELGKQGAGVGSKGAGETNAEIMKRHWRDQIKGTKDQLIKISKGRQAQLDHRRAIGFKTISIVGYTNAGKTTLFNILAKKEKLAKDVLFATLESAVGKLYLPEIRTQLMVTDTIGFIQKLPPKLIDAFKSTLMESINATLLLHVIDASDPKMYDKINVVHEILTEIGIGDKKQLYVFNKTDSISEAHAEEIRLNHVTNHSMYDCIFISSQNGKGIEELKIKIGEMVKWG
ncbi:GTPase HflX [Candidatus Woesebacteria bacterium]|nr:GTPase HflX [Candidatus Woesebacteria bacterium]